MRNLVLYHTSACHLCELAEALLLELQASETEPAVSYQKVDIAEDDALVDRYGVRIPVVKRSDIEQDLGWPFDLEQLRDYLVLDARGQS